MIQLLKPEIRYSDVGTCLTHRPADVFVKAHPNVARIPLGGCWIKTSSVLRIIRHEANGPVFETLNSIYRPDETDETLPKAAVKRASA
jgi:hypothetical protein